MVVSILAMAGNFVLTDAQFYYNPRQPQSPLYGAGGPVQEGQGGQTPTGGGTGGGQGNTIGNLIARIPQPMWISPDLTSLPQNIPRAEWMANVNANPGEGEENCGLYIIATTTCPTNTSCSLQMCCLLETEVTDCNI